MRAAAAWGSKMPVCGSVNACFTWGSGIQSYQHVVDFLLAHFQPQGLIVPGEQRILHHLLPDTLPDGLRNPLIDLVTITLISVFLGLHLACELGYILYFRR